MASSYAPVARFDFGRVVERTFSSIGRNFAVFSMLALLLAGAPAIGTGGLFLLGSSAPAAASTQPGSAPQYVALGVALVGGVFLLAAFAGYVLQAAVVYGVITDLNGRRPTFGECFSTGVRHAFWLLLLAIVATLAKFAGYILFVVPGLMMAAAWIVAAPAQVVERTGVFGSLGRSAELTRGKRWPIFGLMVVFQVAAWMVQLTLVTVGGSFATSASSLGAVTQLVLQPLASIAGALVGAAGVASIYYELRSQGEGIGPEALAAVFD